MPKTSYQRRKDEIAVLLREVGNLRRALAAKANVFSAECRWLGVGQIVFGTVIDGEVVEISREPFTPQQRRDPMRVRASIDITFNDPRLSAEEAEELVKRFLDNALENDSLILDEHDVSMSDVEVTATP